MKVVCIRCGVGTGTSDADTLWSNVKICSTDYTTWVEEVEEAKCDAGRI